MTASTVIDEVVVDAGDYVPNPTQARFHACDEKVKAFLAGYRGGKTRAGAEEAFELAVVNEGLDGMIVSPTDDLLHMVTLRAFHDWESHTGTCPLDLIAFHNIGKGFFQLVNGSRVYYRSAHNPGSLEGTTLAWWWLDEARLVKRDAWRVLIARLSDQRAKRLQGLVTSTPASGWLQEEFGSERPERGVFHGSTRENEHHLPAGYVAGLEKTYSAREVRVLVEGEFGLLQGAVYEEFDRRTHLVDWPLRGHPQYRTRMVWDPGHNMPYVGWAQHVPPGHLIPGKGLSPSPTGAWVIFDELVPERTPTDRLAELVVEKGYKVDLVDCDPAAEAASVEFGIDALTVLREPMRRAGLVERFRFQQAPRWRHIPTGVARLRGMVKNAAGQVRLYVAKHLVNPKAKRGVVKDFENYAYPEPKDGRARDDDPLKDGVHDHSMDAWRYFAVNETLASGPQGPGSIPAG